MNIKNLLLLLGTVLLASCGGGGGGSAVTSNSRILGIALDDPASPSKLYVSNLDKHTIETLTLSTLAVSSLAGNAGIYGTADGTGTVARFNSPFAVTRGSSTEFYVADTYNHGIRKLTSTGVVTTLAGNLGTAGSADGTGSAALFSYPKGITNDGSNLYVTDTYNHTVRQVVIATGAVTTLAGYAGTSGSLDGTGNVARFSYPFAVAVTGGDLYVTDAGNHTIRKVTLAGATSTLAGTAGTPGSADATGAAARFNSPTGLATDGTNLFIADSSNHTIRKLVIATNAVSTLAGVAGSAGSADGTGASARFDTPVGMTIDNAGNLYVVDQNYTRVRKVSSGGVVTTLPATF